MCKFLVCQLYLVSLLQGASEPEDFKLCFQFCKSNFLYHRFLSVNDMEVTRNIQG